MLRPFGSLLCCWLLLLWAHCPPTGASDTAARNQAFIGYTELTAGSCVDHLPDCEERAVDNGCLYDAYTMRTFCSATCNVERCSGSSSEHKIRHKGFASPRATRAYAHIMQALYPISAGHWRDATHASKLDSLKLSSLAISTTVGNPDRRSDDAVEAAVIHSITHGWNVIDTDGAYNGGRAEVNTGKALTYLLSGDVSGDFFMDELMPPPPPRPPFAYYTQRNFPPGQAPIPPPPPPPPPSPAPPPEFVQQRPLRRDITRDMLFVSTKAGYLDSRLASRLLKEDVVTQADILQGHHCIHPKCLEASLQRSLTRLGLETLDVLYLHDAAEVQLDVLGRQKFLDRLMAAFQYLEAARADNLIRAYGLATWDCFRLPPSDPRYLPLAEVVRVAQMAGGARHGFRYIQLPVNPLMPEAWRQRGWQGPAGADAAVANQTLMEVAQGLHIGVYATAPLARAELVLLARGEVDRVVELREVPETAGKLLQLVRSTPGVQGVVLGQAAREWVEANVKVAVQPVLGEAEFLHAHALVAHVLGRAKQQHKQQRGPGTARRLMLMQLQHRQQQQQQQQGNKQGIQLGQQDRVLQQRRLRL